MQYTILLNLSIPTDLAVLYTLYCNGNTLCHWLYIGVWSCVRSVVRPGMDFGPANFPAVIDSPMKCTWFVLGPAGKTAIEFLYASLANIDCEPPNREGE